MTEEQPGQSPRNPNENQSFNPSFQQGNSFQAHGGFGGMQQSLPNATTVLVLGILSIVTCCCYGVIGLILAIVAMVLAGKDKALYTANSAFYTDSSFKNLSAGKVCAIIGLVLNILYLIATIAVIALFGFGVLSDQDALKEMLQQMNNK